MQLLGEVDGVEEPVLAEVFDESLSLLKILNTEGDLVSIFYLLLSGFFLFLGNVLIEEGLDRKPALISRCLFSVLGDPGSSHQHAVMDEGDKEVDHHRQY